MNIRTLASVCAGFAVISGIVAASLWRELRAERELSATLRTEMAGSTGHLSPLIPAPGIEADTSPGQQEGTDAMPVNVAPTPAGAATNIPNTGASELELLKDPEYRKARVAALRPSIEQNYPGLVEELRLTNFEADQLFGLLAEARLDITAEGAAVEGQLQDPAVAAELTRTRRALQKQRGDALRTVLGDARYAQWQEYQRTQSARIQAGTYATALAQAGVPLDSTQTRTIAMAMIEEQERMRQDVVTLARTVNLAYPQTQAQAQDALKRRQEESGQRVLDAVFPYLSAQQLRVLRKQIDLHGAKGP